MRKMCIILSLILCITFFCSCSSVGNVDDVEIIDVKSEYFTEDEINFAIDLVNKEFINFDGCKLTKIGYVGDENNTYLPFETDKPEGLILDCEFTTTSSSAREGFNPNETYNYGTWKWYVERDRSGEWYIANYGVA